MALAWLFTLPAAAIVGALSGRIANSGNFGVAIIAVAALAAGLGLYAARRKPVTSQNVNDYPGTSTPASTVPAA